MPCSRRFSSDGVADRSKVRSIGSSVSNGRCMEKPASNCSDDVYSPPDGYKPRSDSGCLHQNLIRPHFTRSLTSPLETISYVAASSCGRPYNIGLVPVSISIASNECRTSVARAADSHLACRSARTRPRERDHAGASAWARAHSHNSIARSRRRCSRDSALEPPCRSAFAKEV